MIKLALAALLMGLVACGGDGPNIIVFDAPPDGPALCDPRAQTGCEAGMKCSTRRLSATLSEVACVPDGTVAVDGACEYGAFGELGYSNCKAGSECVNEVCKQICDHQGGNPRCLDTHACGRYTNILEQNDMTIAGVCDPKCDPLTQALLVGSVTAACGSQDPAAPDQGCYSFDLVDWTCAAIPQQAKGKTDRKPALANSQGFPFVNGCEAGYISMTVQDTGSMTFVCSGVCAPGKTDSVDTTNVKGDPDVVAKLHDKAAPAAGDGVCTIGKKGSSDFGNQQNCHYMWFWNFDRQGNYLPSPYNDTTGICFTYSQYRVNHDNNTGTDPVRWPGCEELPPAGQPGNPMYEPVGNANDWGCVPEGEAALTNGKRPVNPLAKDVQLGFRPGVAVRHLLRQE